MNMLFQTVVVSVLVTLGMSVEGAEECKRELTRIVGGEEANLSEYPFAVSIQLKVDDQWHHFCGGVILNEVFVLTAGHCYLDTKVENDIMLLRLAEPFDLEAGPEIAAAELPTKEDPLPLFDKESSCVAVGWGLTRPKIFDPEEKSKSPVL
ncbi:unnamed protein product, partial [Cyprideis torosa]